jgi:hypothetical protein
MEEITIEYLQENFDQILETVELGKSYLIKSEYGNVVMIPYDGSHEETNVFCDHNDAC